MVRGTFEIVSSEGCVPVHYVNVVVRGAFENSVSSEEEGGGGGGVNCGVSGRMNGPNEWTK